MKINKRIPFFSNTKDNTHCYQAVLKMILKYYYPQEEYLWDKLDRITAKVKNLWTWPMSGLIWLKRKGLNIKVIEPFDYRAFINKGEQYLIEEYGDKVATEQIKHSNIQQERKIAKKFLKEIKVKSRIPDIDDIKKLILENYLLICNINAKTLENKTGYEGHFVLVKGIDNEQVYLHDPGLPPVENRAVNLTNFMKSWAYPNKKAKNIIAVKLD